MLQNSTGTHLEPNRCPLGNVPVAVIGNGTVTSSADAVILWRSGRDGDGRCSMVNHSGQLEDPAR